MSRTTSAFAWLTVYAVIVIAAAVVTRRTLKPQQAPAPSPKPVLVLFPRRARRQRGAPEDYAPLTPGQEDAWREIKGRYYSSAASERVYPGWRRPWWQRRWWGHVVVVRDHDHSWWRSL